jgi:hypothetical protein
MLSTTDVSEANRRSIKMMEGDIYAKVSEDIIRDELKATIAKERFKDPQLTQKLDEM